MHIAKEWRVLVVGTNAFLRGCDVPEERRGGLYGGEDDVLSRGGTAIVGPDGTVLAGPLHGEEGILYAEIDPRSTARSRRQFDPVGHYGRPEVLRLTVDVGTRPAATSEDDVAAGR